MSAATKQPDLFVNTKYPMGFFAWLRDNGHVYAEFKQLSLKMFRTGRKRYSARTIVEVLRWNTDLRERHELWKLNNNWIPGMARLFMEDHPMCRGFFNLRDHEYTSNVARTRHPGDPAR